MDAEPRIEIKAWYLGNTTVREAQRLRAGLSVLAGSPLNGNLEGRQRERDFALLLNEAEVVRIDRDITDLTEDITDLGRKWRGALMKLGFITADSKCLTENKLKGLEPYSVTENGRRLIASESLPAQQECFLRSLIALRVPSPVEDFPARTPFSPLHIVLSVLVKLAQAGVDASVSKLEMAGVVQLVTSLSDVPRAIERILQFREQIRTAERAAQPKRAVGEVCRAFLEAADATQSTATLGDYADSNFRYLRLTGLFKQEKNRLGLASHRRPLIDAIVAQPIEPLSADIYLRQLWKGAELPTDNREIAIAETRELARTLQAAGVQVELPANLEQLNAADIHRVLHDLEERLLRTNERQYAEAQGQQWENIVEYLDGLVEGRRPVPPKEAPAYFEWAIWRAFLAINSLVSKPWECRKFQVYQGPPPFESFLPVGCARSGGPDLVFEFETFVLVVEVTLTSSSRQEASEGEPVRRHVASYADSFPNKPVYGLFLAVTVDSNTAETFRSAKWFRPDDTEVYLRIVPLTLQQFTNLFKIAFARTGSWITD